MATHPAREGRDDCFFLHWLFPKVGCLELRWWFARLSSNSDGIMTAALTQLLIQILGRLPLRANQWIGSAIGWISFITHSRHRQVATVNLQLCFPHMEQRERTRLLKTSLIETGKSFTEAAWLWTQPPEKVAALVSFAEGKDYYDQLIESPNGLLVATPHWGAWELCSLPLSEQRSFTYMYRPPRLNDLNDPLIQWRANLGGKPASLDAGGIRAALKALKAGETVGLLPDQEPDRDNGVFAPFYKVPANTMTLMGKLASRSNANMIVCLVERKPNAQGWLVRFLPARPDIANPDKLIAATAVNQTVELCIAINPAQYNWSYKRFRRLPDGGKRNYSLK